MLKLRARGRVTSLSAVAGVAAFSRSSVRPATQKAEQQQGQQQSKEDAALQVVENKYVCMINNQRFNKAQIPVEVEGRTYYGCCEMCKGRLSNDPKSRIATDPVSGKEVDKAKAVISANGDGEVFYFENVENLKRYKANLMSRDGCVARIACELIIYHSSQPNPAAYLVQYELRQ